MRGYQVEGITDEKIVAFTPDGKEIWVLFVQSDKLNKNIVANYFTEMRDMNIEHAIIIYKDTITPVTKKIVSVGSFKIELFSQDELQYNITKHRLFPKFRKLLADEAIEFKRKFGTKIPLMLTTDPVSKFFNYSVGDVIEVDDGNIYYMLVR